MGGAGFLKRRNMDRNEHDIIHLIAIIITAVVMLLFGLFIVLLGWITTLL